MLANAKGAAVLETRELDLRMLSARSVDDERAKAVTPLDRALRHVDVLDSRSRHVDHDAPMDALADFDPLVVYSVGSMSIGDGRPALRVPRGQHREHQPQNRLHDLLPGRIVRAQNAHTDRHERSPGEGRNKDPAGDSLQRDHPRIELVIPPVSHEPIVAHGFNCMRLRGVSTSRSPLADA